jgi:hypothetical protein
MEDDILSKFGINWEDLDKPGFEGERETLESWLKALETNQLTLENVKDYIKSLRENAELELTKHYNTPSTWISFLSLICPLIAIIRKWYIDKAQLEVKARLRSYLLIENFLSTPEKAKKAIERQLAMFGKGVK